MSMGLLAGTIRTSMLVFRESAVLRVFASIARGVTAYLFLLSLAFAQTAHPQQPCSELQARPVKALSEQQIADLRAGRGMSLALPAELNGYPGPSHTLENADALGLTAAQRDKTKGLFAEMQTEAAQLGERLIRQETELDGLFSSKTVTSDTLDRATREIGAAQGALRAAHLRYHLAMIEVLSPEQIRRYGELRGYAAAPDPQAHGHRSHTR